MFKRVVNGVEYLAALGVVVAIALMLFYRPAAPKTTVAATQQARGSSGSGGGSSGAGGAAAPDGAAIFVARCSGCHGASGEGGIGPKLAGGKVVREYPNPADEIAIVTNGRGGMPSWEGRLTPEEIQAVVDYT